MHSETLYQEMIEEQAIAYAEHEREWHEAELRKEAALNEDYHG